MREIQYNPVQEKLNKLADSTCEKNLIKPTNYLRENSFSTSDFDVVSSINWQTIAPPPRDPSAHETILKKVLEAIRQQLVQVFQNPNTLMPTPFNRNRLNRDLLEKIKKAFASQSPRS